MPKLTINQYEIRPQMIERIEQYRKQAKVA